MDGDEGLRGSSGSIEELRRHADKLSHLDQTIEELQSDIHRSESRIAFTGDDAQLANVDLQNILQKQQQALQMMSNLSKVLYDTAQAIIRKMGG